MTIKLYEQSLEGFKARVNYAASAIAKNPSQTSRQLASCFECGDGDQVVKELVARIIKNPRGKLSQHIWNTLDKPYAERLLGEPL